MHAVKVKVKVMRSRNADCKVVTTLRSRKLCEHNRLETVL